MHPIRSNAAMERVLMGPDVIIFSIVKMHLMNEVAFVHQTNSVAIMAIVLRRMHVVIMLLTARMVQMSSTAVGSEGNHKKN